MVRSLVGRSLAWPGASELVLGAAGAYGDSESGGTSVVESLGDSSVVVTRPAQHTAPTPRTTVGDGCG